MNRVLKILAILICTYLISFKSFSFSRKIDSLELTLEKEMPDTSRINILSSLAWEYRKIDFDKALNLLDKALQLSEKNHFSRGKGIIYSKMGDLYYSCGDYLQSKIYYEKACEIKKENGDLKGEAKSLCNLGDINVNLSRYNLAIDFYMEAIKIFVRLKEQKSIPYNNIAASYFYLGNYEKATDYYLKALNMYEASGTKEKMINPLLGIGNVYKAAGKNKEALLYYKKLMKISSETQNNTGIAKALIATGNVYENLFKNDSALEYYQKALDLTQKLEEYPFIALSLMNIGNIYSSNENYIQAIQYYRDALEINEKIQNKDGSARAHLNIGILYIKIGNLEKANEFIKKGIAIADSIRSKEILMASNKELSEVFFQKGDYRKAYDYYKKFSTLKDSVLNEATNKNIAEMNTKYETAEKEKEISILTKDKLIKEQELKNQQTLRNGLIIGVFLLLILAGLTYSRYLVKRRANKEIAEKNREITESISYAKRIQTSFLTSEKYISQRLSDYFIFYNPRNIVSGDFYWLMDTAGISTPTQKEAASAAERFLYICTADCTGHGIPGAFMSLISMGILNEIIYSKTHLKHTDEILNELRRIIILAVNPEGAEEEGKDGMDAVLCRFDFDKMELEYSAANNSFFIIRDGQLLIFKPDKMPVGKYLGTERPFTRHIIPIKKGDCIYTFSDGFADQFGGPENKKFQSKRLKELILNHCHKPMHMQKEIFAKTIKEWQGTTEQIDDMLLIGIRI